jgi:hypothetical protein
VPVELDVHSRLDVNAAEAAARAAKNLFANAADDISKTHAISGP